MEVETQSVEKPSSSHAQVILNMLNPLLEILKLWREASLILIHAILYGVEPCITNYNKLLHASA